MNKFSQFWKDKIVEKPGQGTHSAKFDRCVAEVEASGNADNAYAVCQTMVGKEMFKSMDEDTFADKIKMYMQKLGIAGAGPVPNSLLAEQDLETRKSMDMNSFAVWYYDKSGARKCAVFGSLLDAEAYAEIVAVMGYENVKIMKDQTNENRTAPVVEENTEKGAVERTGEQLKEAAKEAEDAETIGEKSDLVDNIKAIQVRRQKATLAARTKETVKSFKQVWSSLNKNSN